MSWWLRCALQNSWHTVHVSCSVSISFSSSPPPCPTHPEHVLPCSSWFSANRPNFFSKLRSLLDTMQRSWGTRWLLAGSPGWPDQKCLNFYCWKLISLGKVTALQVCCPTRFNFHEDKQHASILCLHPHIPFTPRSKWVTCFPSSTLYVHTNAKSYDKPIISGSMTGRMGNKKWWSRAPCLYESQTQ